MDRVEGKPCSGHPCSRAECCRRLAVAGPLQRIEAQAVRGAHTCNLGQSGFIRGRGQRGVAVVPGDVGGAQRLPARKLETLQRKAQAQRQGQAQVRQRLALSDSAAS